MHHIHIVGAFTFSLEFLLVTQNQESRMNYENSYMHKIFENRGQFKILKKNSLHWSLFVSKFKLV